MAGLTGPGKGQTGQTSQTPGTGDPLKTMYRRSQLVLVGAFAMLVGAVIAFALHARVAGIVLLVGMLLCGMASFFFSVKFRNRAVAEARTARAEQAARVTANRKSARPGQN